MIPNFQPGPVLLLTPSAKFNPPQEVDNMAIYSDVKDLDEEDGIRQENNIPMLFETNFDQEEREDLWKTKKVEQNEFVPFPTEEERIYKKVKQKD